MKRFILCVATAALLAGCASNRGPAQQRISMPPAVNQSAAAAAARYMQMAASSDLFEIQSSQLALEMSRDPGIRAFAQMLLNDHSQVRNQMAAAAAGAGMVPPGPAMLPQHSNLLSQLQFVSAGQFDDVYRNMQVMTHLQAIELHQSYAMTGEIDGLRNFASTALPVLQHHLHTARMLTIAPPAPQQLPRGRRAGERG